jgi:hypothetical protein
MHGGGPWTGFPREGWDVAFPGMVLFAKPVFGYDRAWEGLGRVPLKGGGRGGVFRVLFMGHGRPADPDGLDRAGRIGPGVLKS